jgi:sulfonate dioxygenase
LLSFIAHAHLTLSPCADFSFELQPPGLTTFFLLSQPKTGGDTLYSSQVKNLRTLSPIMQDFLRTLKATHSGFDSLRSTKGGVLRRDPIETIHPVVRRHPVTGEEALYVNKQFTRRIVGMKREESG